MVKAFATLRSEDPAMSPARPISENDRQLLCEVLALSAEEREQIQAAMAGATPAVAEALRRWVAISPETTAEEIAPFIDMLELRVLSQDGTAARLFAEKIGALTDEQRRTLLPALRDLP
jgi:hypothetical protein